MRANAKSFPLPDRSMLDRLRDAGRADELIGEIEVRVVRRVRRKTAVRSALAILVVGAGLWFFSLQRKSPTLTTAPAHRQVFALADGSQAELNAHSRLHTDFRFGQRTVRLEQGEAYFDIVSDPTRPFIVETPNSRLTVLGTTFNVRLDREGWAEVTLFTGAVSVDDATAQKVILSPGQQRSTARAIRSLDQAGLQDVLAWRSGLIVLDGLTLAEAVARLSQYHDQSISVDPAVAGLKLGGGYPLDLPKFLEAIDATKSLRAVARGDGTYIIVGR